MGWPRRSCAACGPTPPKTSHGPAALRNYAGPQHFCHSRHAPRGCPEPCWAARLGRENLLFRCHLGLTERPWFPLYSPTVVTSRLGAQVYENVLPPLESGSLRHLTICCESVPMVVCGLAPPAEILCIVWLTRHMPGVHQPDPPGLIHDDPRLLPPWRGSSSVWGRWVSGGAGFLGALGFWGPRASGPLVHTVRRSDWPRAAARFSLKWWLPPSSSV